MQAITFKTFKKLLSLWFLVLGLSACQEIGEVDISCSKVKLLTPPDSLNADAGVFNFKWEELEDVLNYNFELATPNFETPLYYHTDTTTSLTEILVALSPGEYTWRVQALNASSETQWYARTLFVEVSEGLDGVPMNLTIPSDNSIFSETSVQFEWQSLDLAEYYTFQLLYNNSGSVGDVFTSSQPAVSSLEMTVPEGKWFWRVQGEIFGSSPSNYAQRSLTVDLTPPSISELSFPIEEELVAEENDFEWVAATDLLTEVNETIEIFSDQEATLLVASFDDVSSPFTIDLTDYTSGTYYWGIYSEDEAGNYSESVLESFEVQ